MKINWQWQQKLMDCWKIYLSIPCPGVNISFNKLETSVSARHKPAIWGCTPGGGGYCPWLSFLESPIELMLSSNWPVTLQLTIFAIFAVMWPKFWIGGHGGTASKSEKICPGPICTVVQNFMPIDAIVAEISVTGRRKTSNKYTLPIFRSNVWWIITEQRAKQYVNSLLYVCRT